MEDGSETNSAFWKMSAFFYFGSVLPAFLAPTLWPSEFLSTRLFPVTTGWPIHQHLAQQFVENVVSGTAVTYQINDNDMRCTFVVQITTIVLERNVVLRDALRWHKAAENGRQGCTKCNENQSQGFLRKGLAKVAKERFVSERQEYRDGVIWEQLNRANGFARLLFVCQESQGRSKEEATIKVRAGVTRQSSYRRTPR